MFNSPPKIPPDLIKIIVLFNRLATVGLGYSHSGYYHSVGLRMNERSAGLCITGVDCWLRWAGVVVTSTEYHRVKTFWIVCTDRGGSVLSLLLTLSRVYPVKTCPRISEIDSPGLY